MGNMRFKVGDRVRIKSLDWYNENKTIHGDIWFDNAVFVGGQSLYCGCELTIRLITNDSYYVIENDYYWTDEMIEGLVEEEVGLVDNLSSRWVNEFNLPNGYVFKDENGNVINATKIVLEKKKKEYPKTYEECCKVMNYCCNPVATKTTHKEELIRRFQFLLLYRDAYWKIAGDEMGLGKPWKPDCDYNSLSRYIISCHLGDIVKEKYCGQYNKPLSFPTEEMRDAFYENFKELIEQCKELL